MKGVKVRRNRESSSGRQESLVIKIAREDHLNVVGSSVSPPPSAVVGPSQTRVYHVKTCLKAPWACADQGVRATRQGQAYQTFAYPSSLENLLDSLQVEYP
jgi:hypothetical protein